MVVVYNEPVAGRAFGAERGEVGFSKDAIAGIVHGLGHYNIGFAKILIYDYKLWYRMIRTTLGLILVCEVKQSMHVQTDTGLLN